MTCPKYEEYLSALVAIRFGFDLPINANNLSRFSSIRG